jgi:hypothetical protein
MNDRPRKAVLALCLTLGLVGASIAHATTAYPVQVLCPICGEELTAQVIGSTNNLEGQDRDFFNRAGGDQPFMRAVTTCPKCLYSGFEGDFLPADRAEGAGPKLDDRTKKAILDGKALKLPTALGASGHGPASLPAWAKLDLAAQVAVLAGTDPKTLVTMHQRAAWAVRLEENPFDALGGKVPEGFPVESEVRNPALAEIALAHRLLDALPGLEGKARRDAALEAGQLLRSHGEFEALLAALPRIRNAIGPDEAPGIEERARASIELERRHLRLALAALEQTLAGQDELPERPVYLYLVGEIARRLGDNTHAALALGRTLEVEGAPEWLVRYAKEQLALVRKPSTADTQ